MIQIWHDKTAIQVVYKFVQKAREKRKEKKDTIFLIWTPGEGSILHPGEWFKYDMMIRQSYKLCTSLVEIKWKIN